MEVGHDADEVDDGADVRGVEAAASEGGIAGGGDEIGVGPVGERGGDGLAVAVVEKGLGAGLGEAGELHVDGLLEAGLVGLEGEGAGEQVRVLLELVGVGGRDAADVGEVLLDAGLLEAGLGEVLRGADEDAGAAADGGLEGGEVAAGLRREEEDGLLGLLGDGDEDALFAHVLLPGLDAREPVLGRRVGVAAEEDADEEVLDGLRGWEVRVQPDAVAGLEVGDLGDGEGDAVAGDAHVDARTDEIEPRVDGEARPNEAEQKGAEEEQTGEPSRTTGHALSLDAEMGSGLATQRKAP